MSAPPSAPLPHRLKLAGWGVLGFVALCLPLSPALLSIGMGLLVALTAVGAGRLQPWRCWRRNPLVWTWPLWFLVLLAEVLLRAPAERWLELTKDQLPLLLLPLALEAWRGRDPNFWRLAQQVAVWGLLVGVAIPGSVAIGSYVLDPQGSQEAIRMGQSLPLPFVHHIYYSLFGCLALAGLPLAWRGAGPRGRWLLLVLAGLFVLSLHLMASRTGLLLLYSLGALMALAHLLRKRQWLQLLGLALALLLAPVAAYLALPPIQQRVENTREDLAVYRQRTEKNIDYYSLAKRLTNWDLAAREIAQHPWTGVGQHWVFKVMWGAYADSGVKIQYFNIVTDPHNQWILYALMLGLPLAGLCVGLWALYVGRNRRSGWLLRCAWLLLLVSLVDSVLHIQWGIVAWALFLTLAQNPPAPPQKNRSTSP